MRLKYCRCVHQVGKHRQQTLHMTALPSCTCVHCIPAHPGYYLVAKLIAHSSKAHRQSCTPSGMCWHAMIRRGLHTRLCVVGVS